MSKKITYIDILIVAVVVIAAIVVVPKLFKRNSTETKKVTYTVMAENILPEIANSVKPEDNVLLDTKDEKYGRVLNVEVKPVEDTYLDQRSGKYVQKTYDERKSVYLTIEADATDNSWGYSIGKQNIRIGEKQTVSANGYGIIGYIIDIYN